ncbi:MAG: orotate phosphoribosyltransferase [Spirochaetia bacterium]|jgi:orotate phosphoribosyltransferase|nr:orotate phosphoribosyltransferase [Spirochaetia bacterium]
MRETDKELIEIILRLNLFYYSPAEKSSGEGMFILSEKDRAPFFIDINGAASFPYYRKIFLNALLLSLEKLIAGAGSERGERGNKTTIAAFGHSAIPFAALAAEQLELPMVYIRESAKKHGKKNMLEGSVNEGSDCIIFTETYSSAAGIESAVKGLLERKCRIIGVASLINMTGENIIEIEGERRSVESLLSLKSLIDYAEKTKALPDKIIKAARSRIPAGADAGTGSGNEADRKIDAEDTAGITGVSPSASGETGWVTVSGSRKFETDAAEILLELKAVTLSLSSPYRYASGILSPVYCDNRLLISSPVKWKIIIRIMESIIKNRIGAENIEVIAGTSTAGIPHASLLASLLDLPLVYVKSDKGEKGKKSNIEGMLPYGKRVLVVEDLISTGKSSIEAVRILREHGAIVENCIAIFTYGMKSALKIFSEEKCALYTASNFNVLIKSAVEKKYITEEDAEKSVSWNMDPQGWGKKHGYE